MSDRDSLGERGRALEEEYFRKRERALVEKMRQAAAAEEARQGIARKTGIADQAVLQELQELGFTPETISLLPLVPLIQVAWAEGGVTPAERDVLVRLARSIGIDPGSDADRQLTQWLTTRPGDAVFANAGRLVRAMLDSGAAETADLSADDLVKHSEAIAAASGGILGIGRMSAEERALLAKIAADLTGRRA
jgi:tellurite resistance protein